MKQFIASYQNAIKNKFSMLLLGSTLVSRMRPFYSFIICGSIILSVILFVTAKGNLKNI